MKTNLTVHCVVKNEERWIWFALKSILDIADKILVYDTGSSDRTVDIIKTIKSKKIFFEEKGEVDAKGLAQFRREQLIRTKKEWFLILDGDEIRKTLSKDLGMSPEDRKEHNRRVIFVAQILAKNGVTTIVPLISPYRETREFARREIPNFFEVWVKASLDECIKRDPKGL